MSFAMLSDDLMLRLEASGVSRDARLLHVEAIVYCATALTDGEVRLRLARISDADDPDECADELVEAGLWERTRDGFRVLEGMQHQRSRDEVELVKEAARERKERSRRHKLGDHSMCLKGRYCPDGRVTRDRTRDGTRDGTPTYPIPSDPKKDGMKGGESDGALRRAASPPEVPAVIAAGVARLAAVGVTGFAVKRTGEDYIDVVARLGDAELDCQWTDEGPRGWWLTWLRTYHPAALAEHFTEDNWPTIERAIDAAVAARSRHITPPSQYEPEVLDDGRLTLVLTPIEVLRDLCDVAADVAAILPAIGDVVRQYGDAA